MATSAAQSSDGNSSTKPAINWSGTITGILSILTVLVGIIEFGATERDQINAQYRGEVIAAAQEQYTSALGAYQRYLLNRDAAYRDAVLAEGNYYEAYIEGDDNPGNPALKSKREAFGSVLHSELTLYAPTGQDIEKAATMVYFQMFYIGLKSKSDKTSYQSQILSRWNSNDNSLDFSQPNKVLDALDQHFKKVISASINTESDVSNYPSVQSIVQQMLKAEPLNE
jgi:hypothetical protein